MAFLASLRIFAAALAVAVAANAPPADAPRGRWIGIDYGALVDRRALTHSGEPVGAVLTRLGGRPMPAPGERPADALAYRLLDPLLEPYAFVLPDTLDALAPSPDPPMVEVGGLWEPGEAQPAWVELARARRYVLESDGDGRVRACLPVAPTADATGDPEEAARLAWRDAWPVLRHALAGERRRLARRRGGDAPVLDVEVHAYRHELARSHFDLGVTPWRTKVAETGPLPGTRPLDLASLRAVLERGQQVEGARLEPSGRLRFLLGDPDARPSILGRAPTLADLAVAYRAVSRGGYGEPYMSLDRGSTPQTADVNYGGRLRDTALGMVSLLSDVRFKTFSVGIDLLGAGDVREAVRRAVPGFETHLERFAADPSAGAVLNQQTRFWFYPDGVDLTLSEEGDVLAFRKVRMTAASERVGDRAEAAADPPWTRETVGFLNEHYDELARLFPEMADLDESVRWLSLFTWLDAARARGLPVPDLDVLLALDLPSLPTPRRFPQLLSYDVLPPPAGAGPVDVFDRTAVGAALDRLEPARGSLSAARGFRRALGRLDPRIPDQAALAKDLEAQAAHADAPTLDLLAFRAERLVMHARVLATLPDADRARVEARRSATPEVRVFSIGIGGVDLGTAAILARARGRGGKLQLAATGRAARAVGAPAPAAAPGASSAAPSADPPGLPATEWPDHGLGPEAERSVVTLPDGAGRIASRRRPGALVRRGVWKVEGGKSVTWEEVVLGIEGPEARARRRIPAPDGGTPTFQRLEAGRLLLYRFEPEGSGLRAAIATGRLPDAAFGDTAPAAAAPAPDGLAVMSVTPAAETTLTADRDEPKTVDVRLRDASGRDRSASIPRPILVRLVLGREVDLAPGRALPAFTPAQELLGAARTLMLVQPAASARPPWAAPEAAVPGEEDPVTLAASLNRWWSADPSSSAIRAVVGADAAASPGRWARAPVLDGGLAVVAPDEAFPGPAAALRATVGPAADRPGTRLRVVVSAEAPGVLGRRLRAIATDPANAGSILAVVSLGGPVREDLPASLLAEGRLGAVGILDSGPVGRPAAIDAAMGWARAASDPSAKGKRAEEIAGPFTWFY